MVWVASRDRAFQPSLEAVAIGALAFLGEKALVILAPVELAADLIQRVVRVYDDAFGSRWLVHAGHLPIGGIDYEGNDLRWTSAGEFRRGSRMTLVGS